MNVIYHISEHNIKKPLALSIGMFDGVHQGHQSIIKDLITVALEQNLEPAILTFWPHPRTIFNPNTELKLLNTLDEKLHLLENFGVKKVFVQNFDEEFRNLTGEDFVKQILIKKLHVKHLIIGYDHVFGKNQTGNFELLKRMSVEFDFKVEQLEVKQFNDITISSTKVRTALEEGNIELANSLLNYHYTISGKVIHGKKIGRTIGYPTANLAVDENKLLPKNGAYIVEVYVQNKFYKGMLSIGTNPTVNGKQLTVEVYILDFSRDIYDEIITIKFRHYLHDQIKFKTMEKLIARLDEDKQITAHFSF